MKKEQFYWLVGLLEGEGSFLKGPPSDSNRPRISLQMTDEEPVRKAANLMGVTYIQAGKDRRKKGWLPYYALKVKGGRGLTWMRKLRSHMSPRRQAQIRAALASHDPDKVNNCNRKLTESQVRRIRRIKPRQGWVRQLAEELEIGTANIYRIRRGEGWPGIK